MSGEDGSLPVAGRHGELTSLLAELPFCDGLEPAALADLAAEVTWFALPGGATLFEQGDPPDALYIVATGCLRAVVAIAGGAVAEVGRVTAGETVGEMALISGKRRSATVQALRDTELVRLSRESFESLLDRHPRAMMNLARLIVRRLELAQRTKPAVATAKTFAILPHDPDVPAATFAAAFAAALARFGSTELVTRAKAADRTSDWFHRVESGSDYVVYLAEADVSSWGRLCLRQVDCVLLLARAADKASPWQLLAGGPNPGTVTPHAELVLLHEGHGMPRGTIHWLNQHPVDMHHHVRVAADVERTARLLTGRAVGLVLSGGGARGFAHIGVIAALRQAGIPLDLVGGTSMGAIIAAGVAGEWDDAMMLERYRQAFVASNPLSDITIPTISLVKGHKVSRLLQTAFGELQIEDLWRPYFCVSANLTRGAAVVHRRGLLWRWLRASVAIPGVLPPVYDNGDLHVDGGVINNLPVDVMREIGRGPVIGVDASADDTFVAEAAEHKLPLWRRLMRDEGVRMPNILQILWRAGTVNSGAAVAVFREQTDLLMEPPLASVDMLDWKAFDRAIEIGHRHATERLAGMPRPLPVEGGMLPV